MSTLEEDVRNLRLAVGDLFDEIARALPWRPIGPAFRIFAEGMRRR